MEVKICHRVVITSMIGVVLLLNGCGNNEPTEAEIFQAMRNADQDHRMFGDIEKIRAETQEPDFDKIRENIYTRGFVRKNGKGKVFPLILFVKIGQAWQVAM